MAASASESQAQTTTDTVSTQGSSGAGSPTLVAGTSIDYNDPALAEDALSVAGTEITAALNGNENIAATVAQNAAAQQSQQSELNDLLLQAEQTEATNTTPVQPTVTASNNEQYIIVGGFALVGVVLLAVLLRK